jgi:hypothetical protein
LEIPLQQAVVYAAERIAGEVGEGVKVQRLVEGRADGNGRSL